MIQIQICSKTEIVKEIEEHINEFGPNKFRELVKDLSKDMGYNVRDLSEIGSKDIDLIAHRDSLGIEGEIIRIQIKFYKHRKEDGAEEKDTLNIKEVRT